MLITIPDVFSAEEVTQARPLWMRRTGGWQGDGGVSGADGEENLQLPEGHPVAVKLGRWCWLPSHAHRCSCRRHCRCVCFRRCSIATQVAGILARMSIRQFVPWLQRDNGFARMCRQPCSFPLPRNMTEGNCLWKIPTACTM